MEYSVISVLKLVISVQTYLESRRTCQNFFLKKKTSQMFLIISEILII